MTCRVFLGAEIRLDVGFNAAQARLANLARGGLLRRASDDAYDELGTGLARIGPLGAAPGMSRLVAVRFSDMAIHEDFAIEAMRWEAIGPGGALFPALDADIKLTPAGEDAIMLMVAGSTGRRWPAWAPDWTGRSCTGSPSPRSGPSPITSGPPSRTRPPRPKQDTPGCCRSLVPGPIPPRRRRSEIGFAW